jgi:hypothetical protein
MVVMAFLTDPKVVTRILEHLGLPGEPPLLTESMLPDVYEDFDGPPS